MNVKPFFFFLVFNGCRNKEIGWEPVYIMYIFNQIKRQYLKANGKQELGRILFRRITIVDIFYSQRGYSAKATRIFLPINIILDFCVVRAYVRPGTILWDCRVTYKRTKFRWSGVKGMVVGRGLNTFSQLKSGERPSPEGVFRENVLRGGCQYKPSRKTHESNFLKEIFPKIKFSQSFLLFSKKIWARDDCLQVLHNNLQNRFARFTWRSVYLLVFISIQWHSFHSKNKSNVVETITFNKKKKTFLIKLL